MLELKKQYKSDFIFFWILITIYNIYVFFKMTNSFTQVIIIGVIVTVAGYFIIQSILWVFKKYCSPSPFKIDYTINGFLSDNVKINPKEVILENRTSYTYLSLRIKIKKKTTLQQINVAFIKKHWLFRWKDSYIPKEVIKIEEMQIVKACDVPLKICSEFRKSPGKHNGMNGTYISPVPCPAGHYIGLRIRYTTQIEGKLRCRIRFQHLIGGEKITCSYRKIKFKYIGN